MHRLTDLYPHGTEDGGFLLRATHDLLCEFDTRDCSRPAAGSASASPRSSAGSSSSATRRAARRRRRRRQPEAIQAGIVGPYAERTTHGALLLFGVDAPDPRRPAGGGGFPARRSPRARRRQGRRPGGRPLPDVAVTMEGLRRLGVADDELAALPQEFREGMEARAGLLGDLRCNHPRNWTLPERNWPVAGAAAPRAATRVPLSMVHLVVQLRRRPCRPRQGGRPRDRRQSRASALRRRGRAGGGCGRA